jgi:two-component system, chemotaxis family, protein-glutamate methylesterase/glutaminase
MRKIRVLIVDDSALMRQLLSKLLNQDPAIEVVGVAADPYLAYDKIKALSPDVVTLDVEMPRMDGITFLERLMQLRPLPVVMVSSLTDRGAETTLRALELGAVDFVTKPGCDVHAGMLQLGGELAEKVKVAAQAVLRKQRRVAAAPPASTGPMLRRVKSTARVVAIGASTGGTEAIATVLQSLPADSPGIVIVQHMPPGFTSSFARRLDSICRLRVKEAADGDRILAGQVLLAPGDFHMEVERRGAEDRVRVFTAPPVNRFRPSVDVLFHSCADQLGCNCVGAILTGMGNDGARGLLALRQAGGRTIAQDAATCVVFGMPKEAIALGGAEQVLPLEAIPAALLRASTDSEAGMRNAVASPA